MFVGFQFHPGSRTSLEKHDPDLDQTQGWGVCRVFGIGYVFKCFVRKNTTKTYGDPTSWWLVPWCIIFFYNFAKQYSRDRMSSMGLFFHVPTWHGVCMIQKVKCDQLSHIPFLRVCLKKMYMQMYWPGCQHQPVDWGETLSITNQWSLPRKQTKIGC